jgi:hypothetical protein
MESVRGLIRFLYKAYQFSDDGSGAKRRSRACPILAVEQTCCTGGLRSPFDPGCVKTPIFEDRSHDQLRGVFTQAGSKRKYPGSRGTSVLPSAVDIVGLHRISWRTGLNWLSEIAIPVGNRTDAGTVFDLHLGTLAECIHARKRIAAAVAD